MDRFEVFHRILSQSNLSSMESMAYHTVYEMAEFSLAQLVAYFTIDAGGVSCVAARTREGSDVSPPEKYIPIKMVQQVALSGNIQSKTTTMEANINRVTPSFAKRQHALAIPMISNGTVSGVWFLSRSFEMPAYSDTEVQLLKNIFKDVERLIQNTRQLEEQQYELDTAKSELEMNRIGIIGDHPSMVRMFNLIKKLARVPSTVLIQGESGTGKELVANAVYKLGAYDGPFISMNCGSVEPNLLKSELFGHVKGSFTGALKDRPGLFKKAQDGVLFLDELGEMPTDMQVTLLRTLECGEIHPVGADQPQTVNTRIVCATHRDLRKMVDDGKFRNDLRQRLKGLTISVPPLRDRRSDIPTLCDYFIKKYNEKFGLAFKALRPEAMNVVMSMDYRHGNVRELEHIIERAMVFEDDPNYITENYLQMEDDEDDDGGDPSSIGPLRTEGTYEERMGAYAAALLKDAIEKSKGNKTKAMKSLGLSRTTFYSLLNRHGLS
ncbi:Sigma-54-dependent Fis family transcriptional regulator [Sulfidibacter corallicola]|uniref:Sigma-54-dependent Fis family transcriptional regulator n=1 Tax=Sulfidibacter corallicola TaxID=2818388 RepID=A0A8A4TV65_SULCO|nr:sigma-54-dependent Fis family transcriptional regulator [Sulfidibacter corallicola]QTD53373.1 sigma-54-dependent Fis family transcriptional regulator [Sulfidibacter corallicola]